MTDQVPKLAVVLGTYNRLSLLQGAIASIRDDIKGAFPYVIIVVDGGSTDGSVEWLFGQPNIIIKCQKLPLTGAVRAFNEGFRTAVELNIPYVAHFNDDAMFASENTLANAIALLEQNPKFGEVAFAVNTWRHDYGFDYINGVPYANFGVVRLEAGVAVAKAQGDPRGYDWWDPSYFTYAADTQFGVWLWKLGWRVHPGIMLKVKDLKADDSLRVNNSGDRREKDGETFWNRWRDEALSHLWEA